MSTANDTSSTPVTNTQPAAQTQLSQLRQLTLDEVKTGMIKATSWALTPVTVVNEATPSTSYTRYIIYAVIAIIVIVVFIYMIYRWRSASSTVVTSDDKKLDLELSPRSKQYKVKNSVEGVTLEC